MLLRNLVAYDHSNPKPVAALVTQALPQCPPDLSLVEGERFREPVRSTGTSTNKCAAMNYFQTGRSHILLVSTKAGHQEGAVGIVTLEDTVEVRALPGF
jgi:metal transporter CNNM